MRRCFFSNLQFVFSSRPVTRIRQSLSINGSKKTNRLVDLTSASRFSCFSSPQGVPAVCVLPIPESLISLLLQLWANRNKCGMTRCIFEKDESFSTILLLDQLPWLPLPSAIPELPNKLLPVEVSKVKTSTLASPALQTTNYCLSTRVDAPHVQPLLGFIQRLALLVTNDFNFPECFWNPPCTIDKSTQA